MVTDWFKESFSYDAAGRLISTTDGRRAIGITLNPGPPNLTTVSLTQKFDIVGNRTELAASLNGTADFKNTYTYDTLNRMVEVAQTGQPGATWIKPKRVTQEWNSLGQRTKISRFESLTTANPVASTDFAYDAANRIDVINHKQGATTLNSHDYAYDPLSRISSFTSAIDGLTNYTYDQNSQLIGVDNASFPDETFSYDVAGNRNSAGYTTVADNRIVAGDGWTYTYDDEGNITGASKGQIYWTYTWDHRNRLTKASRFGETIDYEYDAFNRLVRRNDTNYVYDEGINPIIEYKTNGERKVYLWSEQVDDLLSAEQIASGGITGNILWPLADNLGSIRDIADRNDASGTTSIANHRRYDSFGQLKSETNSSVDLVFGYTGKFFDEATGLQNNLNRWYSPSLGRFISQDPIGFAGGDDNLYRYVGNEVTGAIDPSGLQEVFLPVNDETEPSVYAQYKYSADGGINCACYSVRPFGTNGGYNRSGGMRAATAEDHRRHVAWLISLERIAERRGSIPSWLRSELDYMWSSYPDEHQAFIMEQRIRATIEAVGNAAAAAVSGASSTPVLSNSPLATPFRVGQGPLKSTVASGITAGQNRPLHIDIGGEGRYPRATNVNPSSTTSTTEPAGRVIPNRVPGRGEKLPFPDRHADGISLENTQLSAQTAAEIVRVIKPGGSIRLMHWADYASETHSLVTNAIPNCTVNQVTKGGYTITTITVPR